MYEGAIARFGVGLDILNIILKISRASTREHDCFFFLCRKEISD